VVCAVSPSGVDQERLCRGVVAVFETDDQDGTTRLCTMLGALVLARATKVSPLSEEILAAAHAALTEAR
jgi:hypothetical protein